MCLLFCELHLMKFFLSLKFILKIKQRQRSNSVHTNDSGGGGAVMNSDIYACTPIKSLFLSIYESQAERRDVAIVLNLCFHSV